MLGSYLKKAIQEQQTYTGLRNFEWRLNSIQKTKKAVNFRGCKFTAFLFYCTFRFARSVLFVLPNIIDTGMFSLSSIVVQRPTIFSTWQFAIVAMNNIAIIKILRISFIF